MNWKIVKLSHVSKIFIVQPCSPGVRLMSQIALVLSAPAVKLKNWPILPKTGSGLNPLSYKLKRTITTTAKRQQHSLVFRSASCPPPERHHRTITSDPRDNWLKARSVSNLHPRRLKSSVPTESEKPIAVETPSALDGIMSVCAACPCGPCGPCCGPCGPCCGNMADCNCGRMLPPPCNTSPRCIQYMQGYYYYPYGTWFCGPYHVSTGGVPCCGPACPGTSCGIAPPNPSLLCSKCGPCCGPCGPCCCGLLECTVCNPPRSWGSSCNKGCQCNMQSSYGSYWQGNSQAYVPDRTSDTTFSYPNWMSQHAPCASADSKVKDMANAACTSLGVLQAKDAWRAIAEDKTKKYPFKDSHHAKQDLIAKKDLLAKKDSLAKLSGFVNPPKF